MKEVRPDLVARASAGSAGRATAAVAPRRGRRAVRAVHAGARGDAPAPAAPRRAADPVRVRDAAGRCARATREFRPVGNRTVWLDDFALSDEQWASFQIPIGLAFFMTLDRVGRR